MTKWREPSTQVSTDAKPGVKPAPCETAATTFEPHRSSMNARMWGGRNCHSSLRAVLPDGTGYVVMSGILSDCIGPARLGTGQS